MVRSVTLAALALLAGLLVAACGSSSAPRETLDVSSIESAIELTIHSEHGITTVVHCPTNAPIEDGFRFVCNAELAVGSYPVNVVEVNKIGGVRYQSSAPLRVLNTYVVERAIADAILKKRHLHSTVRCPAPILQQKGLRFTCMATTNKGTTPFTVTEVNSVGGVTFVGRYAAAQPALASAQWRKWRTAGRDHRDAGGVGGGDHLGVADRAARLDDRRDRRPRSPARGPSANGK